MSVNINLVDKRNPDEDRLEKARKLKGISFGVLILTAFLAILIFALDYRFSASYVQKQEADLLKDLAPYSDKSAKIFIINSKLTDISTLLNKRKQYAALASEIAAGNTGSASIDRFLINDSGITISISSTSLEPIDQFINYTLDLVNKKKISNVTLKNLSFDSSKYVVDLVIL